MKYIDQRKVSAILKTAVAFTLAATLLLVICFASPYWIKHDSRYTQYKLRNMGLWEFCFKGYRHPDQLLNTVYNGCWWVFSRYYNEIIYYLEPGYFVATQVFMSFGIFFLFLATLLLAPFYMRLFDLEAELKALLILSAFMFLSFLCNFIGLLTFGIYGNSSYWLPHWKWNYYSWAYAFGIVGNIFQFVSGILFLLDVRNTRKYLLGEKKQELQFEFAKKYQSSGV